MLSSKNLIYLGHYLIDNNVKAQTTTWSCLMVHEDSELELNYCCITCRLKSLWTSRDYHKTENVTRRKSRTDLLHTRVYRSGLRWPFKPMQWDSLWSNKRDQVIITHHWWKTKNFRTRTSSQLELLLANLVTSIWSNSGRLLKFLAVYLGLEAAFL